MLYPLSYEGRPAVSRVGAYRPGSGPRVVRGIGWAASSVAGAAGSVSRYRLVARAAVIRSMIASSGQSMQLA